MPPNDSKGSGACYRNTYDTTSKKLTYTATYNGLTAPATMAHFHGPWPTRRPMPPSVVPVTGAMASP